MSGTSLGPPAGSRKSFAKIVTLSLGGWIKFCVKSGPAVAIAILSSGCDESVTSSAMDRRARSSDNGARSARSRVAEAGDSSDLSAGTDAFRAMKETPDEERWRQLFRSFSRLAAKDPQRAVALVAAWRDDEAAAPFLPDLIGCAVDRAPIPDHERELVNRLKGSEYEGFVVERLIRRYVIDQPDLPWAYRYYHDLQPGIHRQNSAELLGEAFARISPERFASFQPPDARDCLRSTKGMLQALSNPDQGHAPDLDAWLEEIAAQRIHAPSGEAAAKMIGSLGTGPLADRMEANAALAASGPQAAAWHWEGILSTIKIRDTGRLHEVLSHQKQYYPDDEGSWAALIDQVGATGDAGLKRTVADNLPAGMADRGENLRRSLDSGE